SRCITSSSRVSKSTWWLCSLILSFHCWFLDWPSFALSLSAGFSCESPDSASGCVSDFSSDFASAFASDSDLLSLGCSADFSGGSGFPTTLSLSVLGRLSLSNFLDVSFLSLRAARAESASESDCAAAKARKAPSRSITTSEKYAMRFIVAPSLQRKSKLLRRLARPCRPGIRRSYDQDVPLRRRCPKPIAAPVPGRGWQRVAAHNQKWWSAKCGVRAPSRRTFLPAVLADDESRGTRFGH